MMNAALSVKSYVENSHIRFGEGEVASEKPRRGYLFRKRISVVLLAGLQACLLMTSAWADAAADDKPASIFPLGDGGQFVPVTKGIMIYEGAVIGASGVEGVIALKMKKPNKNGEIAFTATVTTAGNQKFMFRALKPAPASGPFTVTLEGTNMKSRMHTLTVTLEGNAMKGSFDNAAIDGASDAFRDMKSSRAAAIAPFVGTLTGVFSGKSTAMFFSATIAKNGNAKVRVILPGGKAVSCSAKAEVGTGIIAMPVIVRRQVKGSVLTFGFRLAFGVVGGEAICLGSDVSALKLVDKKTGSVVGSRAMGFPDVGAPRVTSGTFKTFKVRSLNLEEKFGQLTRTSLCMSRTGIISGSLKFGTVTAKASGIVMNGRGVGFVTANQNGKETVGVFVAASDNDAAAVAEIVEAEAVVENPDPEANETGPVVTAAVADIDARDRALIEGVTANNATNEIEDEGLRRLHADPPFIDLQDEYDTIEDVIERERRAAEEARLRGEDFQPASMEFADRFLAEHQRRADELRVDLEGRP